MIALAIHLKTSPNDEFVIMPPRQANLGVGVAGIDARDDFRAIMSSPEEALCASKLAGGRRLVMGVALTETDALVQAAGGARRSVTDLQLITYEHQCHDFESPGRFNP